MMIRNPFKHFISKKSRDSRLDDKDEIDSASNRSESEEDLDIATEALEELLISSDTGSQEDGDDEDMHSLSSDASTIALLPVVKNAEDVNDMNSQPNNRQGYAYLHQLHFESILINVMY